MVRVHKNKFFKFAIIWTLYVTEEKCRKDKKKPRLGTRN